MEDNVIRRPILIILFFVVILSLIRVEFSSTDKSSLFYLQESVVFIEGTAENVKIKDSYTAVTLNTGSEKVLVQIQGIDKSQRNKVYDLIGRRIEVSGKITIPQGIRNPLCFDYQRYLKGLGIYTICDTNIYKIKGLEIIHPLNNYLSRKKAEFYDILEPLIGEENFGIAAGILFGETELMDDSIYEDFRSLGIAHILAVSGLHVSIAYGAIGKIFKNKKNIYTDILSLFLVYLYAVLANFSVSVLRASLMLVLKTAAFYLNKKYDSVSAASAAAIVFLLINPYLIFDSGLQLSFAAAYTMGIVLPWLTTKFAVLSDKYKNEKFYKAGSFFLPSIAAAAGTGPLARYHFLSYSPLSLFINPLFILLAGVLLPLGLVLFAAFLTLPKMMLPISLKAGSGVIKLFCLAIKHLTGFLNIFSGSECKAPPLSGLILYYLLFFFFFSESRYILHRKNKYGLLLVSESILILAGCLLPWTLKYTNTPLPWSYGNPAVTFVDVGQGDCIHINYGEYNILIDGGGAYYSNVGEKTLKPYLLKNGIDHIDLAIVTHMDMDHCKGIYELSEVFDIRRIITNQDVYQNSALNENDCCIVCSLNIKGLDFLFMSDADIRRENSLLAENPSLKCDILKVGHHGSAYSTGEDFIASVSPSFAVISVGAGNTYGHPDSRVIELLDNSGIMYGRTDKYGAISLKTVRRNHYIIENAAKDKKWRIPINRQNTLSER